MQPIMAVSNQFCTLKTSVLRVIRGFIFFVRGVELKQYIYFRNSGFLYHHLWPLNIVYENWLNLKIIRIFFLLKSIEMVCDLVKGQAYISY